VSKEHVVKSGECLSSIAKAYGFADWRVIYNDPENAGFKKKRPNPDLIYPGDVLRIPTSEPAAIEIATGQRHKIVIKLPKAKLRILLEIEEPYAYELTVGDQKLTGQSDGKKPIEAEIRADLDAGQLAVWPASGDKSLATTWDLALGHLDPVEELSGVQARLSNLGYYWAAVDGQPSPDVDDAVRRFQLDEQIDPANGLDDTTRARLGKRHDGA
jgi:Putative peptidoglycan binding domain/LysM domain